MAAPPRSRFVLRRSTSGGALPSRRLDGPLEPVELAVPKEISYLDEEQLSHDRRDRCSPPTQRSASSPVGRATALYVPRTLGARVLRLIAEQYAIPFDQLARFLQCDQEQAGEGGKASDRGRIC